METTKIVFKSKIVSTFLGLWAVMCVFLSCDVLEPDAYLLRPAVTITDDKVFVLANNSAFIDLNLKIQTNKPVRLSVSLDPKFGVLSDLGKGLLQYTPATGNQTATDFFEFTARSGTNEIIKIDTVTIMVENDSTSFPCGVYPVDDYVSGAQKNISIPIHVLSNDYICGVDSADMVVSIHRPDNNFPPYFGSAQVIGKVISYTAGSEFENQDKLIYRIHPAGQPLKASYGVVYITGNVACSFSLHDDIYSFPADSLSGILMLPVFGNDSLLS
jgi:hypothetical protein